MKRPVRAALPALILTLDTMAFAASRTPIALRHIALDLPGPPAKIVSHDVNGDGRRDLALVIAYSEVAEIGEDRVEELVHVTTIIPAVFERRELRVYLADEAGGWRAAGQPLPLPKSVLTLERGPANLCLVAMTDEGLSQIVFDPSTEGLGLEPLLAETPLFAGSETFQAALELVHDLDGDGDGDLLFPALAGPAVFLHSSDGLALAPASRLTPPRSAEVHLRQSGRWYPWPEVRELNGDGRPDLVFWQGFGEREDSRVHVLLGDGQGGFAPLRTERRDCHDEGSDLRIATGNPEAWPWPDSLVELTDLDGDGRAEAVSRVEQSRGDGFRKGMKDAKRPVQEYRFHRLTDALEIVAEPYQRLSAEGHAWGNESDEMLPYALRPFQDLDADGRLDLIAFTLDFSMWQAFRVMATKSISIGLDFHVWAQQPDGSFHEVTGLDLSEKLKFDLGDLKLGRFGQFAGDFDGDGRQDFVHLGRGREVTIHSGQPGCRYPADPDASITLEEEPASIDLVRIEDLDGDGRSDLRVTRLLPQTDVDATRPVRLDLYMGGGAP